MEIERRLSSIQWKITRSFLVATFVSAFFLIGLLMILWLLSNASETIKEWYIDWFGFEPTMERFTRFIATILVIALGSALVCGAAIGFYNGRKIKRSLQSLSWAAEKLTRGELDYRIAIEGQDEIAELSEQFNNMASRIENQVLSLQKLVQENAELHKQASQVAVHEERQRLARELHDSISQQLFAIMMTMAACAKFIEKDVERAKRQFGLIEEIAAQAQAEMRALLLHLRPIQLEGKRLTEALRDLLVELKQKHPVQYEWEIDELEALPTGLEEHIFRITQEAISNALRHSRAKKIQLTLKKWKSMLILRISDDGKGFNPEVQKISSSMGLGTIAERVSEMGGVWEINSKEGRGTIIEIRVPLLMKGEVYDEQNSPDYRG